MHWKIALIAIWMFLVTSVASSERISDLVIQFELILLHKRSPSLCNKMMVLTNQWAILLSVFGGNKFNLPLPIVKCHEHIDHTSLFSWHRCITCLSISRFMEKHQGISVSIQQNTHDSKMSQNKSPVINLEQLVLLLIYTSHMMFDQTQMFIPSSSKLVGLICSFCCFRGSLISWIGCLQFIVPPFPLMDSDLIGHSNGSVHCRHFCEDPYFLAFLQENTMYMCSCVIQSI